MSPTPPESLDSSSKNAALDRLASFIESENVDAPLRSRSSSSSAAPSRRRSATGAIPDRLEARWVEKNGGKRRRTFRSAESDEELLRRVREDARRDAEKNADDVDGAFVSNDVEGLSGGERASSWLLSVVAHIVIALILAFIFFPPKPTPPGVEAVFADRLGDQLDVLTDDEGNLNPNEAEKYELTVPEELIVDDVIAFEKEKLPFVPNVDAPFFEQTRVETSELLAGRSDPGLKDDLLAKYGGNATTQEAVQAGLRWLKKQQQKDGSWSLKGPYADGLAALDNEVAATALALLAFQGDGSTREKGEFAPQVRRGWLWLAKQQQTDGRFGFGPDRPVASESLFYTHALCSLALCELLTLEKVEKKSNLALRKRAKRAIDFLLDNQHSELGGWRYESGVDSDISVTGWCLMALETARAAGFEIPQTHFDRISAFLDLVSFDDGAGYAYRVPTIQTVRAKDGTLVEKKGAMETRPSTTATGLMCRIYLGIPRDDPALLRGAESIAADENLVRFPTPEEKAASERAPTTDEEDAAQKDWSTNVYGWYSTSTALKNLGPYNKYWRKWNAAMSRELPKAQEPKESKEAGSWSPELDEYAFGGGRLYVTALSILCLEVYYRHMSLYRDRDATPSGAAQTAK